MKIQYLILGLAIIQLLLLGAHALIYGAVRRSFNVTKQTQQLLRIVFICLAVLPLPVLIAGSRIINPLFGILYTITMTWLGFVLYGVMASVLIYFLHTILGPAMRHTHLRRSHITSTIFTLALFLTLYGLWNAQQLSRVSYTTPIKNLPETWQNKKIVFITDTHFGHVYNLKSSMALVDTILNQNPDVVMIGGDMFDGNGVNIAEVLQPFQKLETKKIPTYFVSGNHEELVKNQSELYAQLEKNGIKLIDNAVQNLYGIQFVGLSYAKNTTSQEQIVQLGSLQIDRKLPIVLMKHVPNNLPAAESFEVDLHLSGHTHGGQVWPGNIITRLIFGKYFYGSHQYGEMNVITSSGVNTALVPLRVASQSELVIITLVKK